MEKMYRYMLAGFMVVIGIIVFIINTVLYSSESSASTGNGDSYILLMVFIAGLVIVVVPGIFVLVRLVRR
jgi:hypothetical protein